MSYLVNQYGKDDSLYPKDPKKRAIVDQRLFFDATVLYQRNSENFHGMMSGKEDPEKLNKLDEAFVFLNTFLEGSTYSAGDQLTIADFALYATTSTVSCSYESLVKKHKNVWRWLQRLNQEIDDTEGLTAFKEFLSKHKGNFQQK